MKLSEIKGERVFDVVADIIDPVISIAMDKDAAAIFERKPCPEGMTPTEFVLTRVKESLPKLVRSHKGELVTIMAAVNGVTPEQYVNGVYTESDEEGVESKYEGGLTFPKLIKDLTDLFTDEEFLGFFA